MDIFEGERLDYVNDGISLIQKTGGLTFGTDALLLAAYVNGSFNAAAELGGGTGIISMLLLQRGKIKSCDAYEVQKEYAELIMRNAEYNGFSGRLNAVCSDIREISRTGDIDIVFTNPPYMKVDSGRRNITDAKNVARHEVFGDISDFCASAKGLLKYGGAFYAVYRPDRLCDIIAAMRENGLEPKRLTLVYADTESEPSMMLVEGKRGGRSGMFTTAPFIIYKDKSHREYTPDMDYIMENGIFPERFIKR